jgi:NADPH2:quinone reductase
MKAAYIETTGPAENIKYGDVATPVPRAGEILVRTKAASLNPIDIYIRAGTIAAALPKPYIVGTDTAGVVEAVGPGVTQFKAGDRVWGSNQGLLGRQGSCAEFVCSAEDWFYTLPQGVRDEDAAAAALVGITAHLGLFQWGKLQAGETVFVNGGTGGVGSMVVQMTKAAGGKVIATVGSADKARLCQSWGADHVLNYKTDNVHAAIKDFTKGAGVNLWYETQREHDFVKMVELMARRGRMIVMAGRTSQPTFPVGPFYTKDLTLAGFAMFNASPAEQRRCADDISRWLAEGKLRPPIGKTFPLAETAAAQRLLEENTLGKAGTLVGKVVLTA